MMNDEELKKLLNDLDVDVETFESLNDEERQVLLNMVNELQTEGSSDTLKSLWYEDYDEIPVDIDTFLDDPQYLGNSIGNTLYPFWREQLREIFKPGSKYFEVVLSGAIGIGKTTIADIGIAYILHKLLCMKNPQSYYGLTKSSIMTINFFNVSLDLSYGVAFSKLQSMLLDSPWFLEHGTVVGNKNEVYVPGKNIEFKVGSQEEHALGQDVFCMTGDTKIVTTQGLHTLEDLSGGVVQLIQMDNNGNLVLSNPCYVMETKLANQLIELTLEDGTIIKGTPEHKLMLKDGSYKMMKDITENDDLMEVNFNGKGTES